MKQDNNSNRSKSTSRLRWSCRRGMLELDVLLMNFLNQAYDELSLEDQNLFVQLLEYSDQELFSWLIGHSNPSDQGMFRIVSLIRQHAQF